MSGLDRRLSGLAPGLSARERVVLILRAIAEGQRDDPAWRRMPDSQVSAFDRYVGTARGINRILVPYAAMLLGEVQTLEWRFQTLAVFVGWATERALLGNALSAGVQIPIPQSEYLPLVAEKRAEYLPLGEAVRIAGCSLKHEGRAPNELERELRTLAASGELKSRGRGESPELENGAFDDWLGEASEAEPDGAWSYEVLPDEVYEHHSGRRHILDDQRERLKTGLSAPWLVLPAMADSRFPRDESALTEEDRRVLALGEQVREGIEANWAALLAAEQVANAAVEEFQDEVVLPNFLREDLALIRSKLERLYADAPWLVGPLERPEPDRSVLDLLYGSIGRVRLP